MPDDVEKKAESAATANAGEAAASFEEMEGGQKPLFTRNTRAIIWGMQPRAVQVGISSSLTFLPPRKLIRLGNARF